LGNSLDVETHVCRSFLNNESFLLEIFLIDPVLKIISQVGFLCNMALGASLLENMFELPLIGFFLTFEFLTEAELCQTDSYRAKSAAFHWTDF